MLCARSAMGNLRVLIVARQQVESRDVVRRHQALNFVEYRDRIEGRHSRFEIMRFEPDRMTIRLARLRAASLPHIRASAATEGHQSADIEYKIER